MCFRENSDKGKKIAARDCTKARDGLLKFLESLSEAR